MMPVWQELPITPSLPSPPPSTQPNLAPFSKTQIMITNL